MDELTVMMEIMRRANVDLWGVCSFADISQHLIPCSAARRLPQNSNSVLVALFPYYTGEHRGSNLSKYAMPKDYHVVVGRQLDTVSQELRRNFPDFEFAPFCDASPVPEVEAARLAGLGCRGENGLLINADYGSFVFIGEVVTDMRIAPFRPVLDHCCGCGACAANCPSGALHEGTINRAQCLSAITQKKASLTEEEKLLIRRCGFVWGCDICQDSCPMNHNIRQTDIEDFRIDLKENLFMEEFNESDFQRQNQDRAFLWRGAEVLKRNLCIIETASEDNMGKSLKE